MSEFLFTQREESVRFERRQKVVLSPLTPPDKKTSLTPPIAKDCSTFFRPAAQSPRFKTVLFDLGDTIVHFSTWRARPYIAATTRPAHTRLIEMGFTPPSHRAYASAMRNTFLKSFVTSRLSGREAKLMHAFHQRHRKMNIPLSDSQMIELAHLCAKPICEFAIVDPTAALLLNTLRLRGIKLGVVSNTMFPGFAIDSVLAKEGLLDLFPVRVYSSEVGYMKPHPRIFQIALEQMEAESTDTLYVGDRVSKDVKGGIIAGLKTALLCNKTKRIRGRFRPDFTINALADLEEIVCG